ncbi:MAG: hypothetical protein C0592_14225 [Marinilabiliales bacterium]|nr:MAG: hypothetical protein C0592_14225 [Marinilabiliales bacterium]
MKILIKIPVKSDAETVANGFTRELFQKLRPPMTSLKILRYDGNTPGDEVHLKVGVFFFKQRWISKITDSWDNDDEWGFEDIGLKLPFFLKSWKHRHRVQKNLDGSTIIEDIDFEPRFRILRNLIRQVLYLQFKSRKTVYQRHFGKE